MSKSIFLERYKMQDKWYSSLDGAVIFKLPELWALEK